MSAADVILGGGNVVFFLALIPSIRGLSKPAITTSLLTGSVLSVYGLTYLFLFQHPFYWAASTAFLNASAWLILAWQRYKTPIVRINAVNLEDPVVQKRFLEELKRLGTI